MSSYKAKKKNSKAKSKKYKQPGRTASEREEMLSHFFFMETDFEVKIEKNDHKSTFTCKIHGIPKPQYRAFATGQIGKIQMVNKSAPHTKSFSNAFAKALSFKQESTMFQDLDDKNPIKIKVFFFFPRPKHHYIWKDKIGTLSDSAPIYVTKTPDLDNCIKLVLDALQDVCYKNDCVVAHLEAVKLFYSTKTIHSDYKMDDGCILIKVSKIFEGKFDDECVCHSCKNKKKH